MTELVTDCPRCGAQHVTMNVPALNYRKTEYRWKHWYEAFSICRRCHKSSIILIALHSSGNKYSEDEKALFAYQGMLNDYADAKGPITLKDNFTHDGPEYLPDNIQAVYDEAVSCLAIRCYNAAATMFRLCIDLQTRPMLPAIDSDEDPKPSSKERRELGLRLKWMFANGYLPTSLQGLSDSVREDANDGAHQGNLEKEDAEDLLDFCDALLERIVTEPEKLRLAAERRAARRQPRE